MKSRRIGFKVRLRLWYWRQKLRVRVMKWRLRLKFAIAVFKVKRWRAFRRGTPIVYKTRGRRPGSIVVMHNKHRQYDYTIYRVINWSGQLRKVYP